MTKPRFALTAAVLNAPDPAGLARFYGDLLGWWVSVEDDTWATARPRLGGVGLSFQRDEGYVAPVWPTAQGEPAMQVHLDIEVDVLEPAVEYAIGLGARVADVQPQQDVRVLLDPVGHPFCLWAER